MCHIVVFFVCHIVVFQIYVFQFVRVYVTSTEVSCSLSHARVTSTKFMCHIVVKLHGKGDGFSCVILLCFFSNDKDFKSPLLYWTRSIDLKIGYSLTIELLVDVKSIVLINFNLFFLFYFIYLWRMFNCAYFVPSVQLCIFKLSLYV